MQLIFLRTRPLIGADLEEANKKNQAHVDPVATIVLSRDTAVAFAQQILDQVAAARKQGT
jgi:hypothetical protein